MVTDAFRPFQVMRQRNEALGAAKAHKDEQFRTIADVQKELNKHPEKYAVGGKKSKYKRTRKRTANPKQKYLYKSQRERLQIDDNKETSTTKKQLNDAYTLAKQWGMVPEAQHCDPQSGSPSIVGKLRVSNSEASDAMCYMIEKPIGWAILGSSTKSPRHPKPLVESPVKSQKKSADKVIRIEADDDIIDFSESDLLAAMTPHEVNEYLAEQGGSLAFTSFDSSSAEVESVTPENKPSREWENALQDEDLCDETRTNYRRIAHRTKLTSQPSFSYQPRPSIVSWLKTSLEEQGIPIKGGNFWTAVAGATEVDDSGLVCLCPKSRVDNILVEKIEYVVITGTNGCLASRSKTAVLPTIVKDAVTTEVVARLRKGRPDDVVEAIRVVVPDHASTCSHMVEVCAERYQQGVRGDPMANPLDRRSQRRLIHCNSMHVTSLALDGSLHPKSSTIPDDMTVLMESRTHSSKMFHDGNFLGRSGFRSQSNTTAFREINSIADGFPGWIVDRYDKWLFVQHDASEPRGPLPSIHDGNTLGVYYLPNEQDRSAMGAADSTKPVLLEGKAAPSDLTVTENGVNYVVSLDSDLSTGIFLDQRYQRDWLLKNCGRDTSVLNCFAHSGAFSVAAAVAGASTVSIDLSKKWLDRLPAHFEANGINFDERHDAIFGDCFDWLVRLQKRSELYDIVILDPPSTSVGGKTKRRWSVAGDTPELVKNGSLLVKRGGLLWTSTNNASLDIIKFARMCEKGLEDAGIVAKLERIGPMPHDFPSMGKQPVKNLVWRIYEKQ